MLRTMAEPLGQVCSVTRRLLRRGLELQTSRCVNVFFPAKGRILFEQASHVQNKTKHLLHTMLTILKIHVSIFLALKPDLDGCNISSDRPVLSIIFFPPSNIVYYL
jgi:hypothetical protein